MVYEVICNNGNEKVKVFVYDSSNGTTFYAPENSHIVNQTYDSIDEKTDINEIEDIDCITSVPLLQDLEDFELFLSI